MSGDIRGRVAIVQMDCVLGETQSNLEKIGDLALVGSMVWSEETLGWVADWHLVAPGRAYRWQIRGVGFDEAFRNAIAGAAQVLSGHGQPG